MDFGSLEYELLTPAKVVFGWGRRRQVAELAAPLGRRALVIYGSRRLAEQGLLAELSRELKSKQLECAIVACATREPHVDDVDRVTAALRQHGASDGDFILALGGGSAIDLAKAAAAMATNAGSIVDYLEGVGTGRRLDERPLPILAMPTTAGTGSEATKNAVISSHDPPFKKSLRSEHLLPRAVLIDPELTVSLPAAITIQTGMDAITQLIESYISRKARPIPQALAVQGLKFALPAIREVARDPGSRPAREAMAQAALLSGVALANSGLGMAHGVAAALGIQHGVTHGLVCAVMLPIALRANQETARESLAELGAEVLGATGSRESLANRFVTEIESLAAELEIPRSLGALGVTSASIPDLVRGSRGNSMDGNPRQFTDQELRDLLEGHL